MEQKTKCPNFIFGTDKLQFSENIFNNEYNEQKAKIDNAFKNIGKITNKEELIKQEFKEILDSLDFYK